LLLNDNRVVAYAGSHIAAGASHGKSRDHGSTGIFSVTNDVSINSNQFSYNVPIDEQVNYLFSNVTVIGGEIRAVGNYFGGQYNSYSYFSLAKGFNIATSNMSLSNHNGIIPDTEQGNKVAFVCQDNNLP
jgi:hypothetical protein